MRCDALEEPIPGINAGRGTEDPGLVAVGIADEARLQDAVVVGLHRHAVAVVNPFQVAVGGTPGIVAFAAIALVGLGQVDSSAVLRLVLVDDGVALVVAGFANQPTEDAPRVLGIGDARVFVLAVDREEVVLGEGAPVDIRGIGDVGPAFDAGEKPLNAWAVAVDDVPWSGRVVLEA